MHYTNQDTIPKNSIFFVGLSHKLWKDGNILEAFCSSTSSWKLINTIKDKSQNSNIYMTNLVKWVPLDENKKLRYPSTMEKQIWAKELMKQIIYYKPEKVFLFGKQVSDTVLNNLDAEKINDKLYKTGETYLVLIDHPSYISVYRKNSIDQYCKEIISLIDNNL